MGFVTATFRSLSSLTNPSDWLIDYFGGGQVSESGATVNADSAMSVSAVWCAVNFLAQNIASLPCPVLKTTGRKREKVKAHPLHQRLNVMANPEMTAMTWRESCIYYQALWGTAISIIERDQLRRLTALWPVHPDRIGAIRREHDRLVYRIRLHNGEEKDFPEDQILRVPGLGNGLLGLSMLEQSRDCLGLSLAMRSYANLFFKNGSNMGVVFEHPKALGETAHKNLSRSLSRAYSGLGKSHKAMVAEEGMKVQKMGVEPEKSQLLEARQFAISDVARWLNLPPHVLKDLSHSNYSNMQQQSLELITYSFRPWFVKLEQSYEAFLLNEVERQNLSVRHNANALMRGDEQSRAEYYRMMFGAGSMTPNEIRQLEDINPIEEPWADKTYLQLNLVPTELLEEVTRANLQKKPVLEKKSLSGLPEFRADKTAEEKSPFDSDDADPDTPEGEAVTGINAIQREYWPKVQRAAAGIVEVECRGLERIIEKVFHSRTVKGDFLLLLERYYRSFPETLKEDFFPVLSAYAELVSREAGRMIGAESVVTEELEEFVEEYLSLYSTTHCGSSIGQLKALVRETEPALLESVLLQRIGEWRKSLAGKIARDQSVRIPNAIAREVWRQHGVTRLKWVTQGSKTCPYCRKLHGRIVRIKEPFLDAGESITGIKGEKLTTSRRRFHPPVHPGCRCAIVPVDAGNRLLRDPYVEAKSGGYGAGEYQKMTSQSTSELRKSLRSYRETVEKHKQWIAKPTLKIEDFYNLDTRRQDSLLSYKWPSDIIRSQRYAKIAETIIGERGV